MQKPVRRRSVPCKGCCAHWSGFRSCPSKRGFELSIINNGRSYKERLRPQASCMCETRTRCRLFCETVHAFTHAVWPIISAPFCHPSSAVRRGGRSAHAHESTGSQPGVYATGLIGPHTQTKREPCGRGRWRGEARHWGRDPEKN
jgi:hypothetical protein